MNIDNFKPALIKKHAKLFLDADIHDDRIGAINDLIAYYPDELEELVFDLLEHLQQTGII